MSLCSPLVTIFRVILCTCPTFLRDLTRPLLTKAAKIHTPRCHAPETTYQFLEPCRTPAPLCDGIILTITRRLLASARCPYFTPVQRHRAVRWRGCRRRETPSTLEVQWYPRRRGVRSRSPQSLLFCRLRSRRRRHLLRLFKQTPKERMFEGVRTHLPRAEDSASGSSRALSSAATRSLTFIRSSTV